MVAGGLLWRMPRAWPGLPPGSSVDRSACRLASTSRPHSLALAARGHRVTGVDLSIEAIDHARRVAGAVMTAGSASATGMAEGAVICARARAGIMVPAVVRVPPTENGQPAGESHFPVRAE
ncbi:hypothetical protein FAIPA1_10155 [Frankia sp. AiPs1]